MNHPWAEKLMLNKYKISFLHLSLMLEKAENEALRYAYKQGCKDKQLMEYLKDEKRNVNFILLIIDFCERTDTPLERVRIFAKINGAKFWEVMTHKENLTETEQEKITKVMVKKIAA